MSRLAMHPFEKNTACAYFIICFEEMQAKDVLGHSISEKKYARRQQAQCPRVGRRVDHV